MKATTSSIFTLLVDNEFGVLTRITSLIRRAGWNIRSLAVAETQVPETSRLTVCLECRHHSLEHVLERLGKLNCVREVMVFSERTQVSRELAILHMRADEESILALAERLGAKILDHEGDEYFLSIVEEQAAIDAILQELTQNGLIEIARTGAVALNKSTRDQ